MEYEVKAGLIKDNQIDYRFSMKVMSFDDVVEFLSKVSLTAYDVVKVIPDVKWKDR